MSEFLYIGWTTVGNEAEAERIANDLIDQRLAACVQIHQIASVYRYKNETHKDAEWRLCIKFGESKQQSLNDYMATRHPYEIPEWVTVKANFSSPDYLKWALEV
ncbi:MAG TPA: divalent-cation tolerance protein CutA [Opitutae bacterium]|nr:divalent-cation tolerance protein CutA [Opitutae bacterium]